MKKFISSVILSLSSVFITNAQVIDENAPRVDLTINTETINRELNQLNYTELTNNGGYIIIPNTMYKNTGSLGICLVKCVFYDLYVAYELQCPICIKDGIKHKLSVEKHNLLRCDRTGAEAVNSFTLGNSQMSNYNHNVDNPAYIQTYKIEEQNNILHIHSWLKP